eukprot:2126323-Rhodomonas_salina.6
MPDKALHSAWNERQASVRHGKREEDAGIRHPHRALDTACKGHIPTGGFETFGIDFTATWKKRYTH